MFRISVSEVHDIGPRKPGNLDIPGKAPKNFQGNGGTQISESPNHEIRYTPAKVTTIYGNCKFFGSFISILLLFKTFLVPFKPFLRLIHLLLIMPMMTLDAQLIQYLDELAVEWLV